MRVLLILLFVLPLSAQITNLRLTDLGDHSAHLEWDVGVAGASQVEFSTTSAGVETPEFATANIGSDGGTDAHMNLSGLAANFPYYMRPITVGNTGISTCTAACTNCGSGDEAFFADNSGFDCSPGEYPRVTTAAEAGPEAPIPPSHDPQLTAVWPITGSTFAATCATLQSQMDAAAAQAAIDGLTHLVTGPPASSETCFLKPTLAANSTGRVVIQPNSDPKLLPPPGVEVDPVHRQHLLRINYPPTAVDWLGRNSRPLVSAPAATSGWRFINTEFGPPDHTLLPLRQWAVSGIVGDTITTTTPHDLVDFEYVYLDLPGFPYRIPPATSGQGTGQGVVCIVGSSIQVSSTFRCLNWDFTGYTSGGMVTAAHPSTPVTSCTNTTPIQCAVPNHGLGAQPALAISAISNSALTIPTNENARVGQAVLTAGTPSATWDGIDWILSQAPPSYTLNGSYTGTCAASCGTTTRLLVGQFFGTGNAAIDQPQLITILDANTIQLEGTTAAGATTGGYFSFDPSPVNRVFDLTNITGLSFDRCAFASDGFPYRMFNWFGGPTSGLAVFDSWSDEASFWSINNPLSNYYDRESNMPFFDTGARFAGLEVSGATDVQLLRSTLRRASGLPLFFGEGGAPTADVTMQQLKLYRPPSMTSGKAGSEGQYYTFANWLELKSGQRYVYRGNYSSGNQFGGFIPRAPVIALSPRQGTGTPITDFDAQWNYIDQSGGTVFLHGSGEASDRHMLWSDRLRFSNNLIRDQNYDGLLTGSPIVGGGNATGGYPWILEWALEWGYFDNNIAYLNKGKGSFISTFDRHRLMGVSHQGNIQIESRGGQTPPWSSLFAEGSFPFSPYTAGTAGVAIPTTFRQEPNADPATTVATNLIIPGVKIPQTNFDSKRESSNPADTVSAAEATTQWGGFAGAQTIIAGATMRIREEIVFGSDNDWLREPAYTGFGMDISTLLNELGYIRDVVVTTPASGSIQIAYTAPSTTACVVRLSTDLDWATPGSITEQSDGGGAQARSVTFPGLPMGVKHAFAIGCPGGTAVRNAFTLN